MGAMGIGGFETQPCQCYPGHGAQVLCHAARRVQYALQRNHTGSATLGTVCGHDQQFDRGQS